MKKDLFLIGGGGHSVSVIDIAEMDSRYKIQGIFDKTTTQESILGYPILGDDSKWPFYVRSTSVFVVAVGQITSADIRKRIYQELKSKGAEIATLISPLAYVSKHSAVGEGSVIHHQAVVNARAQVGVNCIINSRALIEHDVKIGAHCHVATGATINGYCELEDEVFVGSMAVLKQTVKVYKGKFVQAGTFFQGAER